MHIPQNRKCIQTHWIHLWLEPWFLYAVEYINYQCDFTHAHHATHGMEYGNRMMVLYISRGPSSQISAQVLMCSYSSPHLSDGPAMRPSVDQIYPAHSLTPFNIRRIRFSCAWKNCSEHTLWVYTCIQLGACSTRTYLLFFHVRWLLRCSSLYLQLIGRVCGTLFSWCWWSLLSIDSCLPTEEGPLGSHLPMQLSPLFWEPGDLSQSFMFCFSEILPHDSQCMGDFTFIVLEGLNLQLKGHPVSHQQPPHTHPPHTLAFISSLVSSICRCRSCRSRCSRIIPAWEK